MELKGFEHRLAWLAGIIDGEGHIGIGIKSPYVSPTTGKRYGPATQLVLDIENTDPAMLNEVAAIFDVLNVNYSIMRRPGRKDRPSAKPFGRIFVTHRSLSIVLLSVLPYLVTKRDRAELAIRIRQHRQSMKGRGGFVPLDDDPKFQEMLRKGKV